MILGSERALSSDFSESVDVNQFVFPFLAELTIRFRLSFNPWCCECYVRTILRRASPYGPPIGNRWSVRSYWAGKREDDRRDEQFFGITHANQRSDVRRMHGGPRDAVQDGSLVDGPSRLVEWQIGQGTPMLSPVGTTGESPTLSHEEHERVIADRGRGGRRPGQGHGRHGVEFDSRGDPADAIRRGPASTVRCWWRPTTIDPIRKGCTAISPRSPRAPTFRSFFITFPSRTGRNVEPETIKRLATIGPIVAVKEAAGSLDQVSESRS